MNSIHYACAALILCPLPSHNKNLFSINAEMFQHKYTNTRVVIVIIIVVKSVSYYCCIYSCIILDFAVGCRCFA